MWNMLYSNQLQNLAAILKCLQMARLFSLLFLNLNFLTKFCFRNTGIVSNILDPVQALHNVRPNHGPSCLQILSADDKSCH